MSSLPVGSSVQADKCPFSVATFLWYVVGLAGQDCLLLLKPGTAPLDIWSAYCLMQPSPIYLLWLPARLTSQYNPVVGYSCGQELQQSILELS